MSPEKSYSFDSDACIPFLLSQIGQGDVSAITFEAPAATPSALVGSSLFSRLSRGLSNEKNSDKKHVDYLMSNPASPSLSTIKAEDSLFERIEVEDRLNGRVSQERTRWNGQIGQQRSENPAVSRHEKCNFGDAHMNIASPIPIQRSVETEDTDYISCNEGSMCRQPQRNDEKRGTRPTRIYDSGGHDQSVSWDISPSKGRKDNSPEMNTSNQNELCQRLEASMIGSAANVTSLKGEGTSERSRASTCAVDEWREVADPESGRKYYYNRRTRISKWKLPKGAVQVKKAPNHSHDQSHSTECSQLQLHQQQLSMRQNQNQSQEECKSLLAIDSLGESLSKLCQEDSTQKQHQRQEESRRILQVSHSAEESQLRMQQESSTSLAECSHEGSERRSQMDEMHLHNSQEFDSKAAVNEQPPTQSTATHNKPPQDCTSHIVFCLYCGLKCGSTALLRSHLQQCDEFAQMQRDGLPTQIELESILFRAWSQIGSSTNIISAGTEYRDDLFSKHTARNSGAYPSFSEGSKYTSYSSDDPRNSNSSLGDHFDQSEDAATPYETTLKTPTPKKRDNFSFGDQPESTKVSKSGTNLDVNMYCVEKKKCPFCEEEFTRGNAFSSHLLKCPERRRARKQRRTKKKDKHEEMTDPRRKCVTPGRRMPWE